MYAEERQQAMADLVAQRGRLSVNALAAEYDVTTETVRRDLSALERAGLLRRVHGGAVPADAADRLEPRLGDRDLAHADEKERIARRRSTLLPATGGSVLLDAGTTTVRLALMLPRDRRLTVVTHAVPIAARLAGSPRSSCTCCRAGSAPPPRRRSATDTVAALDAAPRRRRLRRHQRPVASGTACPPRTTTRPRPSGPWSRARRAGGRAGGLRARSAASTLRFADARRRRRPRHRRRRRRPPTERAASAPGRRGRVRRMIVTLTANPSLDRTVDAGRRRWSAAPCCAPSR